MRSGLRRTGLWIAAALTGVALLWLTLRPRGQVAADLAPVTAAATRAGLSPAFVIGVVGNVAVFAPLGWLLALALGGSRRSRLLGATGLAAGLSLAIELVQSRLPGRVPSPLDWLLNVLGAALGALAGVRQLRDS
jgi:glycopeptide antibiotics resistance protein